MDTAAIIATTISAGPKQNPIKNAIATSFILTFRVPSRMYFYGLRLIQLTASSKVCRK